MHTLLRTLLAALSVAACCSFSQTASAAVTKTKLGDLRRTDYVVTDVTGGSGGGISNLEEVVAIVTNYDTKVVAPREKKVVRAAKPRRLGPYLWEMSTEGEDWDAATNRFAQVYPSYRFGCTGVCTTNYHGRNLDWNYDRGATVVVRSPAKEGKYAVLGLSSGVVTDEILDTGDWVEAYHSLPFSLSDGINEHGVVIQQNVLQKDVRKSSSWHVRRKGSVILFAMIRYALDRCSTAREAATTIKEKLFIPDEFAYDVHFLVSDRTSSFIVEDGTIYTSNDCPTDVMTNFRTGEASYATNGLVRWETVEPYGIGLERYDHVRTSPRLYDVKEELLGLMKELWYTKAYETNTVPYWYTEHCDPTHTNMTVMAALTNQTVFSEEKEAWYSDYQEEHTKGGPRYRAGVTWQTVHTALYDKNRLTLTLVTQEDETSERVFRLIKDSTDSSDDLREDVDILSRRVDRLSDKTEYLTYSNAVNSARLAGLSGVVSSHTDFLTNLSSRIPARAPHTAVKTLDKVYPALQIETDGSRGFYVFCTDSLYHDLRDTLIPDAGHPDMSYSLTNLYGISFTTNYLSSLFGPTIRWTADLVPSAENITQTVYSVCGGIGYPTSYGRESTVRELLCDILIRDPAVWRDDTPAEGHESDYIDLAETRELMGSVLSYARSAHTEASQLRHDYDTGPVFGKPLMPDRVIVWRQADSVQVDAASVLHVVITGSVSSVSFVPNFSDVAKDDPRSASIQTLITCYTPVTLSLSRPGRGLYVGLSSFSLDVGAHLLTISRLAYGGSDGEQYMARVDQLDYQAVRPDFTSRNSTLVETVDRRLSPTNSVLVDAIDSRLSVSNPVFSSAVSAVVRANRFRRLSPYFWSMQADVEDETSALSALEKREPDYGLGDSGVCAGAFHGVSFGSTYDRTSTVLVRVPATDGTRGLIGLSSGYLHEDTLLAGEWDDAYGAISFTLDDGINDAGVVVQLAVLPRDDASSAAWRTYRKTSFPVFFVVRKALSLSSTAYEAALFLRDKTFVPDSMSQDVHFLVSDKETSYLVEDGRLYADPPSPTLTNFRIGTATMSASGTVDWESVEDYGNGLERYDFIQTNLAAVVSAEDLFGLLDRVRYTKAYDNETSPYWYTEHCSPTNEMLTVMAAKTNQVLFAEERLSWHTSYTNEHARASQYYRNGATRQSAHIAVYDKENGAVTVFVQEEPEVRQTFRLTGEDDLSPLSVSNIVLLVTSNVISYVNGPFKDDLKSEIGTEVQSNVVSSLVGKYVPYEYDMVSNRTAVTVGSRAQGARSWKSNLEYYQGDTVTKDGVTYICTADPTSYVPPSNWEAQEHLWSVASIGVSSLANGMTNVASGVATHAEGRATHASGNFTHAEGLFTHANGNATHAEGASTQADGMFTHAEGNQTQARGLATHAEGGNTDASGLMTHAEGRGTVARGMGSHAEGHQTVADGLGSHAEGSFTRAGSTTIDPGTGTSAVYRAAAHASGWGAVATNQATFVWQGLDGARDAFAEPTAADFYYDHGAGTFNVNPVGGLSGFYVGSQALASIIPQVENNLTSTDVTKALSANMGRELQEEIDNIKSRGRYLSVWDCATGLPKTDPTVSNYVYRTGDYFIVGNVAETNYCPVGTNYVVRVPSTSIETNDVKVNDTYCFDGTVWALLKAAEKDVTFGSIVGSPYDNTNLSTALNSKTSSQQASDISDNRITNSVLAGYLCTVEAAQAMTNALPAWTKRATKPSYTASEVGALPTSWATDSSSVFDGTANSANSAAYLGSNMHMSFISLVRLPGPITFGDFTTEKISWLQPDDSPVVTSNMMNTVVSSTSVTNLGAVVAATNAAKAYADGKFLPMVFNDNHKIEWVDDGFRLYLRILGYCDFYEDVYIKNLTIDSPSELFFDGIGNLPEYLANGTWNTASDPFAKVSQILQPDWTQTNTSAKDYIKNKPTIISAQTVTNIVESSSVTNGGAKAYTDAIAAGKADIGYEGPAIRSADFRLDANLNYYAAVTNLLPWMLTVDGSSYTLNYNSEFMSWHHSSPYFELFYSTDRSRWELYSDGPDVVFDGFPVNATSLSKIHEGIQYTASRDARITEIVYTRKVDEVALKSGVVKTRVTDSSYGILVTQNKDRIGIHTTEKDGGVWHDLTNLGTYITPYDICLDGGSEGVVGISRGDFFGIAFADSLADYNNYNYTAFYNGNSFMYGGVEIHHPNSPYAAGHEVFALRSDLSGFITNEAQFVEWKDGGSDYRLVAGRGITTIGQNSTMYGASTKSGMQGTAIGFGAEATGMMSVAVGRSAKATTAESVAFGASSQASGSAGYATAIGYGTRAKEGWSVALGMNAMTTNFGAIAIGDTCSHGDYSFNVAAPELSDIWIGGWRGTNLVTKLDEKYPRKSTKISGISLSNDVEIADIPLRALKLVDEDTGTHYILKIKSGALKLYSISE